ncbi:MAG: hypothetical protein GX025_06355, partial [Clostridiales bacterium]|nr:hypothetical protein [Clostridiales bacterium]
MKLRKSKRFKTVVIGAVLFILIGSATFLASAIWNEDEAVHIKSDDIESSTLIIGSHLIHLSALTDPIYNIAIESAHESGQDTIYYKSELADGTWFNISYAGSLLDITSGGTPVTKDVIEGLFLTHHTRADG